MPKISVIIPVFNVENFIEASIRSICNQTFRDFEIIVIDDGSSDRSCDIAEQYLRSADVRYTIHHFINAGLSTARNRGISLARGEWVICIDSDDFIHPRMLDELYMAVQVHDCECAFCNFVKVTEEIDLMKVKVRSDMITEVYTRADVIDRFFKREIIIIAPALLLNRAFLLNNSLQYSSDCRFSEDQLFIWEMLLKIPRVAYVPKAMYYYLIRKASIMSSSSVEKVMTGYRAFVELDHLLGYQQVLTSVDTTLILPRWILGTAHASAKMMSFSNFNFLMDRMNIKENMVKMRAFPQAKCRLMSIFLKGSKRFFYEIAKRW